LDFRHVIKIKISEQDYLILRVFQEVEIADLIHAKFSSDSNPCDYEPYWEKTIKCGFSPTNHSPVCAGVRLFAISS